MSEATVESLQLLLKSVPTLAGAEILLRSRRFLEIEVKDQQVESQNFSESRGLGLRLCRGGRMAQAYASNFEPATLEQTLTHCLEILEVSPAQSGNEIAPITYTGDTVAAQFIDPTFEMVAPEEKAQRLLNLENAVLREDSRVKRTRRTRYEDHLEKEWFWTMGSSRILYSQKTAATVSTSAIVEAEGATARAYEADTQTHYYNLNWGAVAKNAAQTALKILGGRKVTSGRYNVLFTNRVTPDFLALLGRALSGENVNRGLSFLKGRVGQMVASPLLHLMDDPYLTKTLGQAFWDAEGVSTRKVSFIEAGVLQGYAQNRRSAAEAGTQSTGHAVRNSERSPPSVGFHNLTLEPGKKDFVDLERDLQRGLVIYDLMGVHTANPVSGEFSFGASGVWYENGSAVRAVSGVVLSGNLRELFSQIVSVGRDLRWQGSFGAPSLVAEGVNVSGD